MTLVRTVHDRPDLHHGSHNKLLTDVPAQPHGRLDAIVVPTIKTPDALRDSLVLARSLGRPLVALCSKQAQAEQSVTLGRQFGAEVLAIDLHEARPQMPAFRTDAALAKAGFPSTSDLSLKRNLGLLIARTAGWERILFLDDDIRGVYHEELGGVAAILDSGRYRAVGLRNVGFPDNSVVCHAYRAIGATQASFIGGGSMIVNPQATRSFFPDVYNEDWFFLLGDDGPFRVARSGRMMQRGFDPYANPRRAEDEEVGDTLAEGLYWLLDNGDRARVGDKAYWGDFLYRRRHFLEHILDEVETIDIEERKRAQMIDSLKAARGVSAFITPHLCDTFLQGWIDDLGIWDAFLERFPTTGETGKALAELGLAHVARNS